MFSHTNSYRHSLFNLFVIQTLQDQGDFSLDKFWIILLDEVTTARRDYWSPAVLLLRQSDQSLIVFVPVRIDVGLNERLRKTQALL